MKKVHVQLLGLIGAAMQGEQLANLDHIEWQEVLEEATRHQVKGMIYPAINRHISSEQIESEILETWKKETFFTGIRQMQHITQVARMMSFFIEEGIEVIVLKGLVVREFYPRPELRTMCDADLMVKKENLKVIEEILLKEGYEAQEASPVHIKYTHKQHYAIEIHWTIRDERLFQKMDQLEEELWKEAVAVRVGEVEVLGLGLEDMMIHLCAHMATHLSVGGFGIRQVIDLALTLKYKRQEVNWDEFCRKVRGWKLEQFVLTIFKVVEWLFGIPYPMQIEKLGQPKNQVVTALIEEIWESGVHGKKEAAHVFANELAKDMDQSKKGEESSVIKNFLHFLFPPRHKLSQHYSYAKKHTFLLPIAWIHHGWNGMMCKEYNWRDKLKFVFTSFGLSKKRNELLKDLEL